MASENQTSQTKRGYTAEQIAVAARDLRDAAGAPEEQFSLEQVVGMLSDEIRLLRERGFSSERIADLFRSFEIEATASNIEAFYVPNDRSE